MLVIQRPSVEAVGEAEEENALGPLLHPTQFWRQWSIHIAIPNDAQWALVRWLRRGGPIEPCALGLPRLEVRF